MGLDIDKHPNNNDECTMVHIKNSKTTQDHRYRKNIDNFDSCDTVFAGYPTVGENF